MQDLLISKQNHKWADGGESMKNSIVKGQTDPTDQQQTKWEIKCLRIWKERVSHPSSQITRMLSLLVIIWISSPGVCRILGYFQLAEQCTPGCAFTSTRTHASPWLQTHPCPNRERGLEQLLSPQQNSDTRKDVLPFPKAVSKAVLHHVLRVANLKQQEQCQATTSSLKH